jgi:hypothetical protein
MRYLFWVLAAWWIFTGVLRVCEGSPWNYSVEAFLLAAFIVLAGENSHGWAKAIDGWKKSIDGWRDTLELLNRGQ